MTENDEGKPKQGGRPSSYTPEVGDQICQWMAEGESLRSVCRRESMPSMSTVMRWAASNETFREQYARARDVLLEHWAEDIVEISDDGSRDYVAAGAEDGGVRVDHDHIARSKLRVDSRKWLLSKLAPKKYGDRTAVDVGNQDGKPLQVQIVRFSDAE